MVNRGLGLLCLLVGHRATEVVRDGVNIMSFHPRLFVSQCSRCGQVRAYDNGMEVSPRFADVEAAKSWAVRAKQAREEQVRRLVERMRASRDQKNQ